MARLVLSLLVLCAAGGLADPARRVLPQRPADPGLLRRQIDLLYLFFHVHEPTFVPEQRNIVNEFQIEKNIEHYRNVTAVKMLLDLHEDSHLLPRGIPFNVLNSVHRFEAVTAFNVLFSAKDYDTFYNTAVILRTYMNEGVFVYILSTAILHRPDTQGIVIPPIYEIFPSYFNNGEIMTTAQRINTHGLRWVEQYPNTFVRNNDVVIRGNWTMWPYYHEDLPISYFTHSHELNAHYYNKHLAYPFWLGGETRPLVADRRGEWLWFVHKQILSRYYMERLSNGLGEIPELGLEIVEQGYQSGLLYHNGIPFPVRPSYYHLDQPQLVEAIELITAYENRVFEAIDRGFIVNENGEHINIRAPESIDVLGRVIEAGVDSPNNRYYKDFISLWKVVLGNSNWFGRIWYEDNYAPLVVPSPLENYQTALRDPAFYMIWKRVMRIFTQWQTQLPLYRPEELALPSTAITKVEVDKLLTYFEQTYVNVTNHLHSTRAEVEGLYNDVSVLVQRPQLNHKVFQVRVHVNSEAARTVVVRFFLAPKYDSQGFEIPLHVNTENFFQFDQFTYDLPAGEHVIKRDSTENVYAIDEWQSGIALFNRAEEALRTKGQVLLDQSHNWNGFPSRFILPKGHTGGMPFQLLVYVSEYRAPTTAFGTGFDPALSLGLGSGANRMTDEPLGFPLNRPLWQSQINNLRNIWIEDVLIWHKQNPDIWVPNSQYW